MHTSSFSQNQHFHMQSATRPSTSGNPASGLFCILESQDNNALISQHYSIMLSLVNAGKDLEVDMRELLRGGRQNGKFRKKNYF